MSDQETPSLNDEDCCSRGEDEAATTEDDNDQQNEAGEETTTTRKGTISSACFNLLSTMVGGGSLSLPLAFAKSGNGLLAPIVLLVIASLSDFCFRLLVASAPRPILFATTGSSSFESVTKTALGHTAHQMSTVLVCLMCFFGTVGYAVLLRDMLEPITDALLPAATRWTRNVGMLVIVLLVTPLCALETLTSLEKFGATSMLSVLILGCCVMFRSLQCVATSHDWDVKLLPDSPRQLLNALPLFISCYVCHYNVLPVHNDLRRPTARRVSRWLRITTWGATAYYMAIGFTGSLYGACTPDGKIQGNILLDFDEHDPLLMVGRMCLALTVTLAFPMLTIPSRDIILRIWREWKQGSDYEPTTTTMDDVEQSIQQLEEPLLQDQQEGSSNSDDNDDENHGSTPKASYWKRLGVSIVCFWTGAAVACCVASIDVVWDLLGSSLSILLSYLIPCTVYLIIVKEAGNFYSRALCWTLLVIFVPLMFISTGNAIDNTF